MTLGTHIATLFFEMNFVDILIIYLACGSPLGVHQITKRNGGDRSSRWMMVVATFLIWPVFAIALLIEFYKDKGLRKALLPQKAAEEIISEIEQMAFADGSTSALFEFRDAFYRYSGLLESSRIETSASPSAELFEVSGRKDSGAAARCLARRNQARLDFHLANTRTEFVELISHIADSALKSEQIFELAAELMDEFGDAQARTELSHAMYPDAKSSRRRSIKERDPRAVHVSVAG